MIPNSILNFLPTVLAPGAYTDPASGMSLGSLRDINNPMMRGNNSFTWNMETAMYDVVELTDAQMTVWDHVQPPSKHASDYREEIDVAAEDYVPSVEPAEPEPVTKRQGYHHVVAADVMRGDLFTHPMRQPTCSPSTARQ